MPDPDVLLTHAARYYAPLEFADTTLCSYLTGGIATRRAPIRPSAQNPPNTSMDNPPGRDTRCQLISKIHFAFRVVWTRRFSTWLRDHRVPGAPRLALIGATGHAYEHSFRQA